MPFYFLWSPQVKQKLLTTCSIITLTLAELSWAIQLRTDSIFRIFLDGSDFLLYNSIVHYQSL